MVGVRLLALTESPSVPFAFASGPVFVPRGASASLQGILVVIVGLLVGPSRFEE